MLQTSLFCVIACLLLQSTSLMLWERIFEMDKTSLEQIVNRIPLPKCQYIGSFPSHFAPTLPNDSFAILDVQPRSIPCDEWIVIALFHLVMYFAKSLDLSIKNYPFLEQRCRQRIPTRLQGHSSVCGFYTIYAAFHLFKFEQEELTGVNDVTVLSF